MARRITTLTVARREQLSPSLVRVVFGDPGFGEFEPNDFTDAYVKLLLGDSEAPTMRTYTVRSVDPDRREIAIDFVVHGDEGVAGPWAARAEAGEQLSMLGPGGAYRPRPDADWHLLAGDESAIPAISAAVEALDPDAVARVYIEVEEATHEVPIDSGPKVDVIWVHRAGADAAGEAGQSPSAGEAGQSPLSRAVLAGDWLPGQVHAFVHGEAQTVMHVIRPYIRRTRGVGAEWASISGYWRRGRNEESFRAWKRDLAVAEQ